MGWHIVVMQNPPLSPQSCPFPCQSFMKFSQDFSILVMIDSLASGNALCNHNTLDIEGNSHHGHEF